ncbi:MAG: hypothetical protein SGI96_15440 [Bacteroidota bacterium]|nr:hypothetical protein [Bacteroidota bacterium]
MLPVQLHQQIAWLFLLALPIACIAWTVTHEEIFKEPRDFCIRKSKTGKTIAQRKFFYLFTCEYCFSHYITFLFLFITKYHLLFMDWRGYLVGGFALIWIANIYMSLFGLIRVGMKREKMDADIEEIKLKKAKAVKEPV